MILIIGYGNPLRGDDGFGWHAAVRLRERLRDLEVEVLAVQQLTPELMDPVSRAGRVIFIDAGTTGTVGELSIRKVAETPSSSSGFTHFSTPAGLLRGAKVLYGADVTGLLVTTAGFDFAVSDKLSAPVQMALETLLDSTIHELLRKPG
jgi:hydrogenase maturation protease